MRTAPVAEGVAWGPAAATAVAPNAATTMRARRGCRIAARVLSAASGVTSVWLIFRIGLYSGDRAVRGLLLLDADVAELDARAMAKETDVAPGVGDPA